MPAPYSQDLRERVIGFMALGGSARAAATRFEVSISSVIRWAQRWRAEGHARPRPMGGDRRSRLSEHGAKVLQLVAQEPDLTLREIRSALAASCGITVGLSTVHRFLGAHNLTLKKRPYMRPSRTARMSPRPDACSFAANRRSTPTAWSSSTRPRPAPGQALGRYEHDAPLWSVRARSAAVGSGAAWSLEVDHACCRPAHGRDQRALCVRGRHQRRAVSRLHRADAGAN